MNYAMQSKSMSAFKLLNLIENQPQEIDDSGEFIPDNMQDGMSVAKVNPDCISDAMEEFSDFFVQGHDKKGYFINPELKDWEDIIKEMIKAHSGTFEDWSVTIKDKFRKTPVVLPMKGGNIVVWIGRAGCGKTTVIQAISGGKNISTQYGVCCDHLNRKGAQKAMTNHSKYELGFSGVPKWFADRKLHPTRQKGGAAMVDECFVTDSRSGALILAKHPKKKKIHFFGDDCQIDPVGVGKFIKSLVGPAVQEIPEDAPEFICGDAAWEVYPQAKLYGINVVIMTKDHRTNPESAGMVTAQKEALSGRVHLENGPGYKIKQFETESQLMDAAVALASSGVQVISDRNQVCNDIGIKASLIREWGPIAYKYHTADFDCVIQNKDDLRAAYSKLFKKGDLVVICQTDYKLNYYNGVRGKYLRTVIRAEWDIEEEEKAKNKFHSGPKHCYHVIEVSRATVATDESPLNVGCTQEVRVYFDPYEKIQFGKHYKKQDILDTCHGVIMHASALTCHKIQGSEYENVAIVLPYASRLLDNSWLYVALTRARKSVTILLQKKTGLDVIKALERKRPTVISSLTDWKFINENKNANSYSTCA